MARRIIRHFPLTAAYLRKHIRYNPKTGQFRWLVLGYPRRADRAGRFDERGYLYIGFEGTTYLSHRLAFFLMTGRWPKNQIDHIDGNRRNNKWRNLRDVSPIENQRNHKVYKTNTSGVTGVGWFKSRSQWRVRLFGKHIGYFSTKAEAKQIAKMLHRPHIRPIA
jgi:hypothetical protein